MKKMSKFLEFGSWTLWPMSSLQHHLDKAAGEVTLGPGYLISSVAHNCHHRPSRTNHGDPFTFPSSLAFNSAEGSTFGWRPRRPRGSHTTHAPLFLFTIQIVPILVLVPIMDALVITLLAFIPIFLILMSVFRSTVLTKYLDDKETPRRQ